MPCSAPVRPSRSQYPVRASLVLTAIFTNHFELRLLGRFQIIGIFPVSAGILHEGIKHAAEQVITQIVMLLADYPGTFLLCRLKRRALAIRSVSLNDGGVGSRDLRVRLC